MHSAFGVPAVPNAGLRGQVTDCFDKKLTCMARALARESQGLLHKPTCTPPDHKCKAPVLTRHKRPLKGLPKGLARDVFETNKDIEGDPLAFLKVSEAYWKSLRNQAHEPHKKGPTVVHTREGSLGFSPEYDAVICGGTLGVFLAASLQSHGHRVALVEKRVVQGRSQEWNISRGELQVLLELGLLSPAELEECIVSEFNPIRVGFKGGEDLWVEDCLNLGVSPLKLIDKLKARFLEAGGVLLENTAFKGAEVFEDGVRLSLGPGGLAAPVSVGDTNRPNGVAAAAAAATSRAPRQIHTRLLLDCMGHYSDIVKQIRGRAKPDGMCLVVGSCAEGFPTEMNQTADLLYSLTNAQDDLQLFWEAFPAEGGKARTTYMFAYSDARPERPSFEQLLDTYFELLPRYQGLPLDKLQFKRVLFGAFPCYSNGPLQPTWDRIMQIGDASAAQSPLSFGGFGSMLRHLGRLTRGVGQALQENRLGRAELGWLHPYQPALSASWLFQRSMSIGVGQCRYDDNSREYSTGSSSSSTADYPAIPALATATATPRVMAATIDSSRSSRAPYAYMSSSNPHAADSLMYRSAASSPLQDPYTAPYTSATPLSGSHLPISPQSVSRPEPAHITHSTAASITAPMSQSDSYGSAATGGPPPNQPKRPQYPSFAMLPKEHVNQILGCNFGVMRVLGDRVLRPFLQDTIQFVPLSLSMAGMMMANPLVVSRVLLQVGPTTLFGWFAHYFALGMYTCAHVLLSPLRGAVPGYTFQRMLDAVEFGSGMDYHYHPAGSLKKPAELAEASTVQDKAEQH